MVSVALVVLTVSTLVVHGQEVSTGVPIIPQGCEGKTLCDIKPDDYPQEEIDNFFLNKPEYLKRLKREVADNKIEDPVLEEGNNDGNCKTDVTNTTPYFEVKDKSRLPQVIVQSSFFDQKIRQVTCWNDSTAYPNELHQCFGALLKGTSDRSTCVQVTRRYKLIFYDRVNNNIVEKWGVINVDCVCTIL